MAKASDTTTTTSRTTHKWSERELSFAATHTGQRSELVNDFRSEFPKFPASDQSIVGRRYRLQRSGHKLVPGISVVAIEARIATIEATLADANADLANAIVAAKEALKVEAEKAPVDYAGMTFAELKVLADEAGVKKSGGKDAIIARLAA